MVFWVIDHHMLNCKNKQNIRRSMANNYLDFFKGKKSNLSNRKKDLIIFHLKAL